MPEVEEDRAVAALEAILGAVAAGKVRPHQSLLKQPYVFLDVEGRPAVYFALFDPAFKHWLAAFAWDGGHGLLRNQELDRILYVLAGRALKTPVANLDDPALLRLIETESVVAVVLEFMYAQASARVEHPMAKLWEILRDFARERGMLRLGRDRFPGGANVLSRKLRQFAEVFDRLGIGVEIRRSDGCKAILARLDDSAGVPSCQSSELKSLYQNDLLPMDDRDRRRAFLRDRKARDPRQNIGESNP